MPWFLMKTKPTVVKAECSSRTALQLSSPSELDNNSAMSTTGIDMSSVSHLLKQFCYMVLRRQTFTPIDGRWLYQDQTLPCFCTFGRRPAQISRAQLSCARARAFTAKKMGGARCHVYVRARRRKLSRLFKLDLSLHLPETGLVCNCIPPHYLQTFKQVNVLVVFHFVGKLSTVSWVKEICGLPGQ